MVVLNMVIIAFILRAAVVVPFLPERLQDSGWATAIRTALIGLLLLVPGLIVIRETQRAAIRGTAVQLSPQPVPRAVPDRRGLRRHAGAAAAAGDLPGQRQRGAERVRRAGDRSRLRRAVERAVRQPVPQQPGRPAVHPRPRDGPHPAAPRRAVVPDRGRLLPADPAARADACPACASTPATGTAPTCRPHGPTGLVLLASGRYTETDVDIDELLQQGRRLRGFWVGLATAAEVAPVHRAPARTAAQPRPVHP